MADPVQCIVCKTWLPTVDNLQPSGGTAFETAGHYGSTITDHMDGTRYVTFVCDGCVSEAMKSQDAIVRLARRAN